MILTEVMDLFGLDAIEVSEHDILRGAALALLAPLNAAPGWVRRDHQHG